MYATINIWDHHHLLNMYISALQKVHRDHLLEFFMQQGRHVGFGAGKMVE